MGGILFYCDGSDTDIAARELVCLAQSELAIVFEGKNEVLSFLRFDEHHVLDGAKPAIGEDIAKGELVFEAAGYHFPEVVVFGLGTDPSLFARFLVGGPFRLLDELERHREGDVSYMIETGHEVDAFDVAAEGVVPVPADQLTLIGVEFFFDAVIDNEDRFLRLDRTHEGLDQLPQIGRSEIGCRKKASDLVVTNGTAEQGGQSGGCRQTERTDQVVGIEIEKLCVHDGILPPTRANSVRVKCSAA